MTSCTTNSNMAVLGVEGFRSVFITEPRSEQIADLNPAPPPKNFETALADMIAEAQLEKEQQKKARLDAGQKPKWAHRNVLPVSMDLLIPVASEHPLFVPPTEVDSIQTVTYVGTEHVDSEPRLVFKGKVKDDERYSVQVVSRSEGLLVARQNVQPFSASENVTTMFSGVNAIARRSLTEALGVPVTRIEIGYNPTEALLVTFRKPHSL
jgi:hypothetical protein